MTIRTQFQLSIGVIIVLSFLIGSLAFVTAWTVQRANMSGERSNRIVRELFRLAILVNHYLVYREDRVIGQWEETHDSLGVLLDGMTAHSDADRNAMKTLRENHAKTDALFADLVESNRNGQQEIAGARLASALLIATQAMVTESVLLADRSFGVQQKTQRWAVLFIECMIVMLMVSAAASLLTLYRRILLPINTLNIATGKIASGNWNYRVAYGGADEFGRLARAFNSMSFKVSRHITEQKKLEQQRNDFIAAASHELKTPLTSLMMYANLLEKALSDAGSKKSDVYVRKMNSQLMKLAKMVNDLLDVQKIEGGKLMQTPEVTEVNELILDAVEDVRQTTQSHRIIVRLGPSVPVRVDRMHIQQVLTNLITNAVKYSAQGSEILIGTEKRSKDVLVRVTDSGIGIEKRERKKIFERFYRARGAVAKTYPGLGLGLFISRGIVRNHGGRIWVDGRKGNGSVFTFSLPILNGRAA